MPLDITDPILGQNRFLGRYQKPGFKYASAKSVVVPASSSAPAYYVIAGRPYTITKDLECNLTTNGAGGLAASLTIAASTIYYLYGVLSNGQVKLVADSEPPTSGPQDFTDWTYLGAFATTSSSVVSTFISLNGFYKSEDRIFLSSTISTTGTTSSTVTPCPSTIKYHFGFVIVGGTNAGGNGDVTSINSNGTVGLEAIQQVSGISNEYSGIFAAHGGSTIYRYVSNVNNTVKFASFGWIEDPSEYD